MTTYALIFKNDGTLFNSLYYTAADIPPVDCLPPDTQLVTFDETTENFEFLYAYYVDDVNKITSDYLPPQLGGSTYNFETKQFSFQLAPPAPTLLDMIRAERNLLLARTDALMHVPDYPEGYIDEIMAYRAALRDITDNLDPSWTQITQVVWPTPPNFI